MGTNSLDLTTIALTACVFAGRRSTWNKLAADTFLKSLIEKDGFEYISAPKTTFLEATFSTKHKNTPGQYDPLIHSLSVGGQAKHLKR